LLDFPDRQLEIVRSPEFTALPEKEQSRLLRLMASKTLIHGKDWTCVQYWLDRSRQLNPKDWRTSLSWLFFHIHPKLLSMFLTIKAGRDVDPRTISPFADMKIGGTH